MPRKTLPHLRDEMIDVILDDLHRPGTQPGKYFTWIELVSSATAYEHHINNYPSTRERVRLYALVQEVLDPLRKLIGTPIHVTSGYRCEELNAKVGGVPTSKHRFGQAADIQVPGTPLEEVMGHLLWLSEKTSAIDKVILETRHNRRWVHVQIWDPLTGKPDPAPPARFFDGQVVKDRMIYLQHKWSPGDDR